MRNPRKQAERLAAIRLRYCINDPAAHQCVRERHPRRRHQAQDLRRTMSEDGRTARNVLLGLMKTCRKLGFSFYRYLGDRLRVPGAAPIPPCRRSPRITRGEIGH
jgi:hypothetical protein